MRFGLTLRTILPFLAALLSANTAFSQSNVVINEVMASNQTYVTDENGEYEDWIELHNKSNNSVNIGGWFLTDNPDNLDKWEFPTNTVIPALGYLIVWADEDSSQGPLHANFKLSAAGEELLLVNASGSTVQDIVFGQQEADKGYARSPNGTGNFVIKNPTFKANNDTGVSAVGDEEEGNTGLVVSPNPATDGVVVLRSKNTDKQTVVICDQLGRPLWKNSFTTQASVDISEWTPGVYFIKSMTDQQILVKP